MRVLTRHSRGKPATDEVTGYPGNLSPFRVKCNFVALRLPYLLGTPDTMRRQGYQMGQQHRAAGYLLQILQRGASAESEPDGSRQLYTVEGRSLIRTFAGYATKKPTIDTAGAASYKG